MTGAFADINAQDKSDMIWYKDNVNPYRLDTLENRSTEPVFFAYIGMNAGLSLLHSFETTSTILAVMAEEAKMA